jgi:hypothetical protein
VSPCRKKEGREEEWEGEEEEEEEEWLRRLLRHLQVAKGTTAYALFEFC